LAKQNNEKLKLLFIVVFIKISKKAEIHLVHNHGCYKDFPRGGLIGEFSKNILGGPKGGEICFFPLQTTKTAYLG